MVLTRESEVVAPDGYPVPTTLFQPRGGGRGAIVLAPAMAVPQRFYAPLATWLAERGWAVVTFDYRGVGRSRRGSLRKLRTNVLDWANLDAGAVLAAVRRRHAGAPVTWIGHSLSGQIVPFVPGAETLDRVITIGSGSGYWRENAKPLRHYVWALWYLAMPVSVALCGYYPGRVLRMVGDLPRGVARQWRRWCLHPEYAVGVEPGARHRFAAMRAPVHALSFTDDEFMSERNVASLHGFYVNARVTRRRLDPREFGLKRIGHFGFFREQHRETLWRHELLPLLGRDAAVKSRVSV
ncbi:alpha/beta fold hydrolase [Opitutus sp. ER46]|uniref:alpha/beta hydrolase family protein n=1 Tax=Opitutus sp. ER46 TaxID=2161864 RepID=UPI000D30659A|nr:alpha/beta fold hydrolase [Opitutus sp. ER46]PTX91223.1 alpha/beta hydrolase [Opitutus sp. ER46]